MRVLELGTGIAVAFAGRLLIEQGHNVHKWVVPPEPFDDKRLWDLLNADKFIEQRHAIEVKHIAARFDAIIEHIPPVTLAAMHVSPADIAKEQRIIWVSMQVDNQNPYLAGLYGAFIATSTRKPGCSILTYDKHIRRVLQL